MNPKDAVTLENASEKQGRSTAAPGPRILHVINSLGGGGAERSLVELLPFYAAAGFDSKILCLKKPYDGLHGEVEREGVEIRSASGARFSGWLRETRGMIREEAVDLVHTTIFESDVVGRVAAWRSGTPVLTSLVNTSYDPIRLSDPNVSRSGLWLAKLIDGWTARHLSTHFHAITRAVKDAAVRHLGLNPERISVVERGRDADRLGVADPDRRRRARRNLGIREDDEVVVQVGRQDFQKGQRFLLEAAASLVSRRPRLTFLIVGRTGHASRELRRLQDDLGLGERIRFLGHRDDVPELLAAADVFAFPSLYEGQGGALVEAMGLSLPVVGSDIPAVREVVEDGRSATLVPPGRPNELASAIEELLEDTEKARAFGRRGRRIFEERFTLERSAARMIELYREILRRHHGDSDPAGAR